MPTNAWVGQRGLVENNEVDNKKFPGGGYSDFIKTNNVKCIVN